MPPKTKPKVLRKQTYIPRYQIEFPWSRKDGEHRAFCTICMSSFGIDHGGAGDFTNHAKTEKHLSLSSSIKTQPKIGDMLPKADTELNVIEAECVMVSYIIEHDLALLSSDHMSDMITRIAGLMQAKNPSYLAANVPKPRT